jgi:plasmid replication initiation protein
MEEELFTEEELKAANTPESLGVTPRFVLQSHTVSRGTGLNKDSRGLSSTARKLAAMAMALLPPDLSNLTASFSFAEFCKALGYDRGGESYKIFKKAVDECMTCVISVETAPDENGKKEWKKFTWFTAASFSEKTGQATMKFSSELAEFLKALKWMYKQINLKDIGLLQSRYAIHLFEIAMSYQSMKGKSNAWTFRRGFPEEIRQVMGVDDKAYKDNHVLKQKVIDNPIKEINKAGLGLEIKPVTVKEGRRIVAINFECTGKPRTVRGRKKADAAEAAPSIPAPDTRVKVELEEKEFARLKEFYPNEYAERYNAAMDSRPAFLCSPGMESAAATFADNRALLEMKEKHGIVK